MNKKKKFLLIGWDAADWKVIEPLMNAGLMPTLKKFLEEGVHGNIATLDPPLSPMLWTSIATGKRAYDHGILGFTEPREDGRGIRPIRSTTRKVKAIWNILNQNGYKTNVVGWWPSHPAEPVNGAMVSNMYQVSSGPIDKEWPMLPGTVHPEKYADILSELRLHPAELTGAHIKPFIPKVDELDIKKDRILVSVIKTLAHASSIHNASTWLMEETDWDFFAVYHDAIDHFSHACMKFHPPKLKGIKKEEFEKYKYVVNSAYRFHDMMLERLLKLAGDDTTVMIISDHGFHSDHLRPLVLPKEPAAPAHEHRPYGIFCLKGPGIKKGEKIYGASLLDITPTILYHYGLPVGKDMEGRPLVQCFEKTTTVEAIPSWEQVEGDDGRHPESLKVDPWAEQQAMEQLIELGYIDKPDENVEKALKTNKNESMFYLARSYVDAGKNEMAKPILEQLIKSDKPALRYVNKLLQVYLALGDFGKAEELIDEFKASSKDINSNRIKFFEGQILHSKGHFKAAGEIFEEVLKQAPTSASLRVKIGKIYNITGDYKKAEKLFRSAIEIDPEDVHAHHGLGVSLFHQNKLDDALDQFLTVVEILYYHPYAHAFIGEILFKKGMYPDAANAFEIAVSMAPKIIRFRKWLVEIYNDYLDNPERAALHEKMLPDPDKEIVIVSGLPRSGTSMTMQMLVAGGMDALTDRKREADKSNPKGYFEYEKVKRLAVDSKWMDEAQGKALKVIAQLLPFLPDKYRYKVIFMERDLNEIMISQQLMRGYSLEKAYKTFPYKLAQIFENQLERATKWLDDQPNIEYIRVRHSDVISDPANVARRIKEFTGRNLDTEKMASVVDPSLHRVKQEDK